MGANPASRKTPGQGAPPPNETAQLFFILASEKRYLTDMQCSILKGIAGNKMDLDGLLSLVTLWDVAPERLGELQTLAREIQALPPDQLAARIQEIQKAPPKLFASVPMELQWFCYLAVRRGLLTEDQCIELDAELGQKRDFLGFAQAVVVLSPEDKFAMIQQLVEASMDYANTGRPPPARILDAAVNG